MTNAIGGLDVVETIFNWLDTRYALVNSVLAQDFPVGQFVFAIIAVFANFSTTYWTHESTNVS